MNFVTLVFLEISLEVDAYKVTLLKLIMVPTYNNTPDRRVKNHNKHH